MDKYVFIWRTFSNFSKSLRQTVNDNSKGKLNLNLFDVALLHNNNLNFSDLIKLPVKAFFIKQAMKKYFWIYYKIHLFLIKKFNPDYFNIFNAGAYIQHHYFHSSDAMIQILATQVGILTKVRIHY